MTASHEGVPVAAIMYMVHGDAAYAHVLGYTEVGYHNFGLYALIGSGIQHFAGSVRWLDLMGVPGAADAGSGGIRRFKSGWSQETRPVYLCGRILNPGRYEELTRITSTLDAQYFPKYRDGEMV